LEQQEQHRYFAVEVTTDTYLIGCENGNQSNDWGRSLEFGGPTGNSWLIKGQDKAILIDSAAPLEGVRAFAEQIAKVPVMLVLSHAHIDHIYRLKEFDEFWIHPDDEALLHGQYGFPPYEGIPETVHYLQEGDVLDIGNGHRLEIYHVPGHTDGSILLLDPKTRTLFSSDTIARRLLYGLGKWIPLDRFIGDLKRVKKLEFDFIYSCHDRAAISKKYIDLMIESLKELPSVQKKVTILDKEFLHLVKGDEREEAYFDFVVPLLKREECIEALAKV